MCVFVLLSVDANDAGSGELSIIVNNGNIPSSARSDGRNIYTVSFMPCGPGIYNVEMFFNCQPLKGEPQTVHCASPCFSGCPVVNELAWRVEKTHNVYKYH